MIRSLVATVILHLLLAPASMAQSVVDFVTADSVRVYGDYYSAGSDSAAIIILFHQAGANGRSEYQAVIPRLLENGYALLVIDQRSGGDRFGGSNRTVAGLGGRRFGYCEAMPDLQASVDYAAEHALGNPIIVWGSSYSAGLVVRLAAERPDQVSAVLAFSPAAGEPMKDCSPNEAAAEVTQPLLALRPSSEMENPDVADQLARYEELGHQTYVAMNGVHGSSMLDTSRTGKPVDETWAVVLAFLETVR